LLLKFIFPDHLPDVNTFGLELWGVAAGVVVQPAGILFIAGVEAFHIVTS